MKLTLKRITIQLQKNKKLVDVIGKINTKNRERKKKLLKALYHLIESEELLSSVQKEMAENG